ncbi:MAG: GNAT family N-acetyltransferase [Thermodesulfobacteriota bacterium]
MMVLNDGKLRLRPLEAGDLERARVWVNDPETAQALLRVLPVSQVEQQAWYEAICRDPSRLVWAAEAGGEHIGNCGFYHLDLLHRRAEAWFLVGVPTFRGQGLGKAMTVLLAEYAFAGLGLNKLYLHVGADNQRAINLYRSLGFSDEGLFRDEYFIRGAFREVLRLALFAADWRRRGPDK